MFWQFIVAKICDLKTYIRNGWLCKPVSNVIDLLLLKLSLYPTFTVQRMTSLSDWLAAWHRELETSETEEEEGGGGREGTKLLSFAVSRASLILFSCDLWLFNCGEASCQWRTFSQSCGGVPSLVIKDGVKTGILVSHTFGQKKTAQRRTATGPWGHFLLLSPFFLPVSYTAR